MAWYIVAFESEYRLFPEDIPSWCLQTDVCAFVKSIFILVYKRRNRSEKDKTL